MELTWMGTACFSLGSGRERILFDPFVELDGGTTAVTYEHLLSYDTIFVTHCHFDHLADAGELIRLGGGENTLFCTKQCCETLEGFLEDESNVVQISPGQTLDLYRETGTAHEKSACPAPGEPGFVRIRVLQGRHIAFRGRYLPRTMTPLRTLRYAKNLPYLFWANRTFREAGEITAFDIRAEGRQILLLGSLALDPEETYPEGADVLILPYQGSNDLPACAREVLSRLRPKSVLLSHFDNAFPPLSEDVDLRPLKKLMQEEFPGVKLVRPEAMKPVRL